MIFLLTVIVWLEKKYIVIINKNKNKTWMVDVNIIYSVLAALAVTIHIGITIPVVLLKP